MASGNYPQCSRCARAATNGSEEPGYLLTIGTDGDLDAICPGCLTVGENIALADFDVVGMEADPRVAFQPSL